jgi:hypothetical protein
MGVGIGPEFAPDLRFVAAAFDWVFARVDVDPAALAQLREAYLGERWHGSPEAEPLFNRYLPAGSWHWPWFDEWADRFEKMGSWPPGWQDYSGLLRRLRRTDNPGYAEALGMVEFNMLRKWVQGSAYRTQPAIKSRLVLEAHFLEHVPEAEFRPLFDAAMEQLDWWQSRKRIGAEIDRAKIGILMRTISIRTSTETNLASWLRQAAQGARLKVEIRMADEEQVLPLIDEAVARANRLDLSQGPPFFPGSWARFDVYVDHPLPPVPAAKPAPTPAPGPLDLVRRLFRRP